MLALSTVYGAERSGSQAWFDPADGCLHLDHNGDAQVICAFDANGFCEIRTPAGEIQSANPKSKNFSPDLAAASAGRVRSIQSSAGSVSLTSFSSLNAFNISSTGDVTLSGTIAVNSSFEARARNIDVSGSLQVPGGQIALLPLAGIDGGGALAIESSARLNVSSTFCAGKILLGGEYQGSGGLPRATRVSVAKGAEFHADALEDGQGGRIILWSDSATEFHGSISANGGRSGGDGGFVEVSSKGQLGFDGVVNTNAAMGAVGKLLLDPAAIEIVGALPDINGDGTVGDDITTATALADSANFGAVTSVITTAALKTVLIGSDVTLASTGAVDWLAQFDINGLGAVGRTLTINSGAISFRGAGSIINSGTTDKLNLIINASNTVSFYSSIATGGGDLKVTSTSATNAYGIQVGGAVTLDTNGGELNLAANGTLEGIHIGISAQLKSGTGLLTINGTGNVSSGFIHGVYFDGDVNITQPGPISIFGTGKSSGAGIFFKGNVHVESTANATTINGNGTGRHGIFISSTTQNAPSATAYFAGFSSLQVLGQGGEFGIFVPGHDAYTPPALPTVPADYGSATFISANGPVTILGNSRVGHGAVTGVGRHAFQVNGTCAISGAGDVSLSALSNEIGVMVLQTLTVGSTNGTTTIDAESTGRHGLQAIGGFDISGGAGVNITANSTQFAFETDAAITINSSKGPITINATAVEGPVDAALTAIDPSYTHGEGKRAIDAWNGLLTVHGSGDVSITANSKHSAINSRGAAITSDSGKVTIDAEATIGSGTLAFDGDGLRALTFNGGGFSVSANGDILIKARDTNTSLESQGFSVTSTNGSFTYDVNGGPNTFHAFHVGAATINAKNDVNLTSDSEINTGSLSVTSTAGAINVKTNTTRVKEAKGLIGSPMSFSGLNDVNISTNATLESISSTNGFTATSTNGAVTLNCIRTNDPAQSSYNDFRTIPGNSFENIAVTGGFTVTAAKDISVDARSTGENFSTDALNLTSTAGKVTFDSSALVGSQVPYVLSLSGDLTLKAAGEINFTASNSLYGTFIVGNATIASSAAGVSLFTQNIGREGLHFGSLKVDAVKDINISGAAVAYGLVVSGAETLTSTTGAVTITGDSTLSNAAGHDGFGLVVKGTSTIQAQKDITVTGLSQWHAMTVIGAVKYTSDTGGITVLADSTAAPGMSFGALEFIGGTTMNAHNDISLTGKSAWFGTIFNNLVNLTSTNGSVTIIGDASLGTGPHYQGTTFTSDPTITALNDISISGKASWAGIITNGGFNLTSTAGKVTLTGDASVSGGASTLGIVTHAESQITANSDISITGKSSRFGLCFASAATLTSTSGSITVVGDATAGTTNTGRYGIDANSLVASAPGNISLTGKGTEFGVNLYKFSGAGSSFISSSGQIIINADSTIAPAVLDHDFVTSFIQTGRQGFTSDAVTITGQNGVQITGKGNEFGIVLYGLNPQITAPNGVVSLNLDATNTLAPIEATGLAGGQEAPTGRHGIASGSAYTLDGHLGVSIVSKAKVFAIELLDINTIHSDAGPITLNGTSNSYYGIFSEASISGVGIDATGINLSGVDNLAGIDLNSGTFDATTGPLTLNGTAAATDINVQGVLVDAGTLTTTGSPITITGTSPAQGVKLAHNSTINSNGGNISISGTNTAAFGSEDQGVVVEQGLSTGAQVSSKNGNIDITGQSMDSDGILVGSPFVPKKPLLLPPPTINPNVLIDVGTCVMTLTADQLNLTTTAAPSLAGANGTVILQPFTPSLDFTVGGLGTSDAVFLSQSEIGQIKDGFASIVVGRADSSGLLTVTNEDATFLDNVTLRSPVNGPFAFAGNVNGSTNNVTLINGGLFTRTGGTVNANVLTLSGTGDIGTSLGNGIISAATTIAYDKAGHNVYGIENDAVNLQGFAGTLTLADSGGAITQTNPLIVSGATNFNIFGEPITLTNANNQFGPLTYTGADVAITQANAMNVLTSSSQSAALVSASDINILGTVSTPMALMPRTLAAPPGPITLQHSGTLTVAATGAIASGSSVTELGTGPVVLKGPVSSTNAPVIFDGAVTAVDGLTINSGTSSVTFNNAVSPGLSGAAKLNITGDLILGPTSNYAVDITGQSTFDQIVTTGTVTAGGKLSGSTAPGITDATKFPIVLNGSATPVTSTFTGVPENGVVGIGNTFFVTSYVGGDGNDIVLGLDHAPFITSAMVAPIPLHVGIPAIFTAMASDPDNNTITFTYDYGDGSSDTTGVHVYTAPGVYSAVVTASDGGLTASTTLSVVVISDIRFRANLSLNLDATGGPTDTITLKGYLYIPAKTTFGGKIFTLQIGSKTETFVLKETGQATSASGVAKLVLSPRTKLRGGDATFKVTYKKASYKNSLNLTTPLSVQEIPLILTFNGMNLISLVDEKFKAHGSRIIGAGKAP